jgi:protocatechuate 3,4-dioxygenase beta subunit
MPAFDPRRLVSTWVLLASTSCTSNDVDASDASGRPYDDSADTTEPVDPIRGEACATAETLPATCIPTSPDGEGPYWRPDAPERSSLNVKGAAGTPMFLAGRVVDAQCAPVEGVRVYLWSASPDGTYDHLAQDPNLYGYQTTSADGAFCFETLRPAPYGPPEARLPAHFHLNVLQGAEKRLTTQLRFAGDPYLGTTADPSRIVEAEQLPDGSERVAYDLVLRGPSGAPTTP